MTRQRFYQHCRDFGVKWAEFTAQSYGVQRAQIDLWILTMRDPHGDRRSELPKETRRKEQRT